MNDNNYYYNNNSLLLKCCGPILYTFSLTWQMVIQIEDMYQLNIKINVNDLCN